MARLNPMDTKEIKPVNPKENQPLIFIGRTDAKAPILWSLDAKSWLIGKDPDAGKDGGQEEKGMTEDEMVGWPHWLNGHEFKQTPGDGEGQGSLVCCSPRGGKESDMTEWLNNNKGSCHFFSPSDNGHLWSLSWGNTQVTWEQRSALTCCHHSER